MVSLWASQLGNLFPTKWSFLVFNAYMVLYVNQGILVKASQSTSSTDGGYSYNIVLVVLCGELLKFCICLVLYQREYSSWYKLIIDLQNGFQVGLLYMIPAFLYCLYNNLAFVNLANYDPTTYFILLQFRNVVTAVFYQILFKKKLTKLQWFSLVILTTGCIVKEIDRFSNNNKKEPSDHSIISEQLLLILLQILCSCFAGVFNEYLLKDTSVHLLIQNLYMYINSILCNVLLTLLTSSLNNVPSKLDFAFLFEPLVILILVNGALAGIVTSFFLKSLNSIMKTFAATIEIVISAILCHFIFAISVGRYTILSIFLIFIALIIYSAKPMVNTTTTTTTTSEHNAASLAHHHSESFTTKKLKVLISK